MATRPNITWPFIISTIAIVLAGAVLLMSLQRVLVAAFTPGYGENEATAILAEFEQDHREDMSAYEARIKGRSLFYKPTKRPQRHVPIVVDELKIETPVAPPPVPEEVKPQYSGPTPAFLFGETVWFQGTRLDEPPLFVRKGESKVDNRGTEMSVIEIDAPATVLVKYGKWEYELNVFEGWDPALRTSSLPSVHGVTITNTSIATETPEIMPRGDAGIPSTDGQGAVVADGVAEMAGMNGPPKTGETVPLVVVEQPEPEPGQFPDEPQDDTAGTGGPPE